MSTGIADVFERRSALFGGASTVLHPRLALPDHVRSVLRLSCETLKGISLAAQASQNLPFVKLPGMRFFPRRTEALSLRHSVSRPGGLGYIEGL